MTDPHRTCAELGETNGMSVGQLLGVRGTFDGMSLGND
jgi:hypothetical protein